ncbi:hypothetical protein [Aeromonas sanarellii]|uniref:hypothetical protein n=1 Tax=Aeromonas sanarellii TaxID=633415 RepID=UPI0038D1E765
MEVQNLAGLGIDQARQGTAKKPSFDASNVNDQLGATLNQGGLLMRMAQSKGQGLAASRGLGNSTIGIDAAQRAMVDAALPIAQQNAQQANSRFMQDDSQSFTAGQADLDRKQQSSMLDKQQSWQGGQNALDRTQQLTMQGNDFKNQTALNTQNAALQKARDQLLYQQQLGTLSAEGALRLKELDAQLKNQMTLNNQQNQFTAGQSALDRQQQLTMQGNDYTNQSKLNTQQAQLQQRRDQLLYQQNLGTLDKQGQLELQQLNAQLKNQTTLNSQEAALQKERDNLLYQQSLGTLSAEGAQRLKEINTQNQFTAAEAAKDRQQAITLLEKQFGQETSQLAQQVAANTHGMYLGAIDTAMSSYNERYAALMADSTIKTADKTTMLKNMKNELNSTLTMYQKLYSNINTINPDWTKFPTTSLPGVKVS